MKNLKNSRFSKVLSLILALIFIAGAFAGCGKEVQEETTVPSTTQAPKETVIRNPLTGEPGYSKKLLKNRPVLISVENSPAARPQWGLTSSDIVWEMVVEGGITRMLLMYADYSRLPEKVGPVRSARQYFVDIAEGYDAMFLHIGGSPYAKNQIANHKVDTVDGTIYDGTYYKRDSGRYAPHNTYTTKELISSFVADKEYRTEIKDDYKSPFKFNAKAKTLSAPCKKVTIAFSSSYTYTYSYNAEEKVYKAKLNDTKFVDSDGKQQSFENIIICYTTRTSLNDGKGRVDYDFSEGTGVYISNGSYTDITWKKGDSNDMIKFYNKAGDELSLNVGRTYIAVMDKSAEHKNTITK